MGRFKNPETQQHYEKASFPRCLRDVRICRVCTIHSSACRQEGQDRANRVQGCSKAGLHQGRQSDLRQVQICRLLLQGRFGVDKCQGQFLQQVCFCRLLQQVSQGVRIC